MKAPATWQLARDYAAGNGLETLAQRYALSRSAILYRLRRAGVPMRRCGAPLGNQNAARGRRVAAAEPPPPSPGGTPIPGDEEYTD